MSQLRTAKRDDVGAFPGATYVVDDTPPNTQCEEAQIFDDAFTTNIGSPIIGNINSLNETYVVGKKLTLSVTPSDDGTYNIIAQTATTVTIDHNITGPTAVGEILIHDAGQAYLTRNEESFIKYIEDNGKAHTTKGGQLFTDIAAGPMAGACTNTFAPE